MRIDDTILWSSFTSGDRASFEEIYRLYFPALYEYGIRRTGNEELTRDTIQDLFIKLWSNRAGLGITDNIKFYLLTSFKNSLINALIRQDRKNTTVDPDRFLLNFSIPAANTREESRQQQAQLLEALNQLSPRQKEIIWLRYFEELDYDRIAILLDISVSSVYKLHYRALDTLRDILKLSQDDLLLLLILTATEYIMH